MSCSTSTRLNSTPTSTDTLQHRSPCNVMNWKQTPSWKKRRRAHSNSQMLAMMCVLVLLVLQIGLASASIFNMGRKKFNYEGLINAGSLGMDQIEGQVTAFGDYNGDSAVDLFVVSGDASSVSVYLWDHNAFAFQQSPASKITVPSGRRIANIIPADFNFDGRLDLLVMMKGTRGSDTEMMLWLASQGEGYESTPMSIPSASSVQPFALDATGDMHTDLLGYTSGFQDHLSLWKNTFEQSGGQQAFETNGVPFDFDTQKSVPTCKLADPHSSAFIDLNGDCLADLFLVCADTTSSKLTYQIWIAVKSGKDGSTSTYTFARSGTLPPGTGALSFADMDRDGTIDVVFPSCEGSACYINIAYNRQMPLCSNKRSGRGWLGVGPGEGNKEFEGHGTDCRDPEANLCIADANFSFDFSINEDNDQLARIPIASVTPEKKLLITDELLSQPTPLPLSLGDYNKDGHPDMAVITIPDHARRDETRLHLLQSIPCSTSGAPQPGCPADPSKRSGRRTFEMIRTGTGAIDMLTDIRSVSFFDLAEDGSLDMLLQRLPHTGPKKDSRQITFIQNNFFFDAFMLKVMTSNGACSSYCENVSDSGVRYKPWGVNYGGASYKFTVLDTNGIRRAQQVGQLAQTAYRSLLTPYSYFGLGRTNNYVEALFIGTTKRREVNYIEIEGVIPNSQVMILPWEEGGRGSKGGGDTSTWKKELYLSPGDWIPWVGVVLATIIVILLGFVFVLHLNEKREDERERKRAVHAINFDAL